MEQDVKARLDELEKQVKLIGDEFHQTVRQFSSHVLVQQKQIGSLRGPEGARGERGETGAPGKDGLTEAEIRQLVEKYFQAHVGDAHKALVAEIAKFRKVVDYVESKSKNATLLASDFVGFVGQLESSLDRFVKAVGA